MSKTYYFRKQKERQKNFSNSFHVNEKFLPSYNALDDPYLSGFFDKPQLKKHLKQMRIIKRKKKRNISPQIRPHTTQRRTSGPRAQMKLPILDDYLTKRPQISDPQRQIRTAASGQRRRSKVFSSKKDSDIL